MEITLIHLTDLHWLPKSKAEPAEKANFDAFISALKEEDFSKFYSETNLLMITGDVADNYGKRFAGVTLKEQFEESRDFLINEITSIFKHDHKFIIPGNHDVDRYKSEEKDRVEEFKKTFNSSGGWITPFNEEIMSMPGLAEGALVWSINSSPYKSNVEKSYPAKVNQKSMDKCGKSLGSQDVLRIALLHHNPLPQRMYGGGDSSDHFINNGDFNEFLIDNNFNIVLSGHYHLGSCLHLGSPLASSNLNNVNKPGYVSIGGRSLLRYVSGETRGFNIIKIKIEEGVSVAGIELNEFSFEHSGSSNAGTFTVNTRNFDLILKPLNEIFEHEGEVTRRSKLLSKIIRMIHTKEAMSPLERVAGIEHANTPIGHLTTYLGEMGNLPFADNIRRMGAVSTLHPSTWWARKLIDVYRAPFLSHYSKARNFSEEKKLKNERVGVCHFKFSEPLELAIQSALKKAERFDVTTHYKNSAIELDYDDKIFLDRAVFSGINVARLNTGSSVSIWDNEDKWPMGQMKQEENNVITGDISATRGAAEGSLFSSYHKNTKEKEQLDGKVELFRILLWPPHWFENEYAIKVISFHESFAVPLFWLNPKKLTGRDGTTLRKSVGWVSICAQRNKEGSELNASRVFVNDRHGFELTHSGDLYESFNGEQSLADCIWGKDNGPRNFKNEARCHYEGEALLSHPDLVLAADAWAMFKLGKSELFNEINYPDEREQLVHQWATMSESEV